MTVIAELNFELTYYDVTVQHINHYTTGLPQINISNNLILSFSRFWQVVLT